MVIIIMIGHPTRTFPAFPIPFMSPWHTSGLQCTCNSKTTIRLSDMNIIIYNNPKLPRVHVILVALILESIGPNWKDNCFLANSHWNSRGYLSMGLPTDQEPIKWFMYKVSQIVEALIEQHSWTYRYCRGTCTCTYAGADPGKRKGGCAHFRWSKSCTS